MAQLNQEQRLWYITKLEGQALVPAERCFWVA